MNNEWTDVNTAMPITIDSESDEILIVDEKTNIVTTGYYNSAVKEWVTSQMRIGKSISLGCNRNVDLSFVSCNPKPFQLKVSHWMPKPLPPKKEKKDK